MQVVKNERGNDINVLGNWIEKRWKWEREGKKQATLHRRIKGKKIAPENSSKRIDGSINNRGCCLLSDFRTA